jgi:hypothetical protein
MAWRTGDLPMGWGWLEPALIGASLLVILRAAVASVRVRIRRPKPSRSRVPTLLRRALSWLSLTLSLSTSPVLASGRFQAPPSRKGRPLPEAPWSGTSGFSPPHPLAPSGSELLSTPSAHPAIHGGTHLLDDVPRLFERAGMKSEADKELAQTRHLHPSGSPQPVTLTTRQSVAVKSGDCLWAIAAEVLATDDPVRIDRYWKQIFAANRSVIGADPDRLLPGQVLELPRETTA